MTRSGDPQASLRSEYNEAADEAGDILGRAGAPLNVYGFRFENNHSGAIFVKLFNAAAIADVDLAGEADHTFLLPASGVAELSPSETAAMHFSKGLVYAATAARNNATAPTADPSVHFFYSQD